MTLNGDRDDILAVQRNNRDDFSRRQLRNPASVHHELHRSPPIEIHLDNGLRASGVYTPAIGRRYNLMVLDEFFFFDAAGHVGEGAAQLVRFKHAEYALRVAAEEVQAEYNEGGHGRSEVSSS